MTGAPGSEVQRSVVDEMYKHFCDKRFSELCQALCPTVSLQRVGVGQEECVLHGREHCIQYLKDLRSGWSDITIVVREFLLAQDIVSSNGLLLLYPSVVGHPTAHEFAHEWHFEGARITSLVDISALLEGEVA